MSVELEADAAMGGIEKFLRGAGVTCEIERFDGTVVRVGDGEPTFRVMLRSAAADAIPLTE